jgi:hypothetical protein
MSATPADVWVQNALLHANYCSTTTEECSVRPRLLFSFDFTQGSTPQPIAGRHSPIPGQIPTPVSATLILCDFAVELRLGTSNKEYYVGQLVAKQVFVSMQANVRTNLKFGLDLDQYELKEIERLRESKDLQLTANFTFTTELQGNPQTKAQSNFQLGFKIPKSDWVETLLPVLGLKTVSLIEIPTLTGSEFEEVISHIDDAWKQYSMGEFHRVLTDCRKALESLVSVVKSKGYETTLEQQGKKENLPDWDKLLGNNDLGDIVGTISKKTRGFIAPGSHTGKTINREDADFALMVTHALVNLITRKLAETS